MTGGLIQLVAYGPEDLFLTKDPQITFFKMVYRRHTNFSREEIPQYFVHTPNFGKKTSCILSRSGDLIEKIYLVVVLPNVPTFLDDDGNPDPIAKVAWVRQIGYAIINSVEIEIGGVTIDKHYGEWMYIWNELTGMRHKGFQKMIGNIEELIKFSNGKNEYKLFIPLQFWFCKDRGLSLPIVNLKYNDVKINVELNQLENCLTTTPSSYIKITQDLVNFTPYEYIQQTVNGVTANGIFLYYDIITQQLYYQRISRNKFQSISDTTITNNTTLNAVINNTSNQQYLITGQTSQFQIMPEINTIERIYHAPKIRNLDIKDCFLLVNYIYVDDEERVRFSQTKQEYLIDQIQYVSEKTIESNNRTIKLDLTNPCKAFIWVAQQAYLLDSNNNDIFNYTDDYIRDTSGNLIGKNLISSATLLLNGHERISYREAQYFNWLQPYQHFNFAPSEGINVYSFCLFPQIVQPSGSANMSKIDSILLQLTLKPIINFNNVAKIRGYAITQNILRINNGISGLVFSD